jgi:hypothetical protein
MAKIPTLNKIAISASTKAVDFRKLSDTMGYIPKYNLLEALLDCAQYYKK